MDERVFSRYKKSAFKVAWYPKMDQKDFFNMVKKDQLWAIALKKRNSILKVLLKMVAMETNHFLLR